MSTFDGLERDQLDAVAELSKVMDLDAGSREILHHLDREQDLETLADVLDLDSGAAAALHETGLGTRLPPNTTSRVPLTASVATMWDEPVRSLLSAWLPRQRWFGAKDHPIRSIDIASRTQLLSSGEPDLDLLLLAVSFVDGSPMQHYQLLLAQRENGRSVPIPAMIGYVEDRVVYDGLWDADVTRWLYEAIRYSRVVEDVRFLPEPGDEIVVTAPGKVLSLDHSNTSICFGEQAIFKLFRRVIPGLNPDLDVHRALRELRSGQVAALRGTVQGTLNGQPATLGILQDYEAATVNGWPRAVRSVRDGLTGATSDTFTTEAAYLGAMIAAVHAELRQVLGAAERGTAELADDWHARLTLAAAEVRDLMPHVVAIRTIYDAVAALNAPVPVQRVHGNLHLAQVLRTPRGWLLIDFEGEPAASAEDRARPDSVLRDVAGMLRSFDYAASTVDPRQATRASAWALRSRTAFCDGYTRRAGIDPREQALLLRAFELDKAVYEALYETGSRPDWTRIPLASVPELCAAPSTGKR